MDRAMLLDPWADRKVASKFRSNLGPVRNKGICYYEASPYLTRRQWPFNGPVLDATLRPIART